MTRGELLDAIRAAEHDVCRLAGRRDVAMLKALGAYRKAVQEAERDTALRLVQEALARPR